MLFSAGSKQEDNTRRKGRRHGKIRKLNNFIPDDEGPGPVAGQVDVGDKMEKHHAEGIETNSSDLNKFTVNRSLSKKFKLNEIEHL